MPLDAPSAATPGAVGLRTPLRVKNMEPNKTVFAKVIDGNSIKIEWMPKDHPGDTERVPLVLIEDIDFLKSLESGVLKVVAGPPDVMEHLAFETQQVRAEREEERQRMEAGMDRSQDKDVLGLTCIGPAPAGRDGECGKMVIQSATLAAKQPPLCPGHEDLAPHYYLSEVGSKGEGATESSDGVIRREWRKSTLGPRQKAE